MDVPQELYDIIKVRHNITKDELDNVLLNSDSDYSKTPIPVLLQPSIVNNLINTIKDYNITHNTNFGLNIASILALKQIRKKRKKSKKYKEQFQLENTPEGTEFLIKIFKMIEDSEDPNNNNTIMKSIEKTQSEYGSRQTSKKDPKLFPMFLPTGNINILQKTIIRFIKDHNLWSKFNVEYSNSNTNSDDNQTKKYIDFVDKCLEKTRIDNKKGCILLLGKQGKLGITYDKCDVTLHLDNGSNIDDAKQAYYRAFTEGPGKTIGINVDLNIQRVYCYVKDKINEYKKFHKNGKSYSEILQYLYEEKQFIFNPNEFEFGNITDKRIEYFEKYDKKLKSEIFVDSLLDNIECIDDLPEDIYINNTQNKLIINPELNGLQQDCPEGETTKTKVDSIKNDDINDDKNNEEVIEDNIEEYNEENKIKINRVIIIYRYLIPYFAYHLVMDRINPTNKDKSSYELLCHNLPRFRERLNLILKERFNINEKDLKIILDKYIKDMSNEKNEQILNDMFESVADTSPIELRKYIEQHFIPTNEQRKQNAEISTPTELVDIMINKLIEYNPDYFKNKKNKTFEPCCGKGNFVLAIFEKYFEGLSFIGDVMDRSRIIIEECMYFVDIDSSNIDFIRKSLIWYVRFKFPKKYRDQWETITTISKFKFNGKVCNTLELDIKEEWGIDGFNAVIGNPPYNSSGNTGTGNTIWQYFTKQSLNHWLNPSGNLLFVHPPGWRKPNTSKGKFYGLYNLMTSDNQMKYLSIHGIKDGQTTFKCGTRYDWYLIEHKNKYEKTRVNDENDNPIEINMNDFNWLPNSNIEFIKTLLSLPNEEKCNIIYSSSAYDPRRPWMSKTENDIFKYPCIQSTNKAGTLYKYSSINTKGLFNIKKVIFGFSGINTPIIDIEGKYGMTQHAMGIGFDNLEHAINIKKSLMSDKFKVILKSCLFSQYIIDWNIFSDMKKDFWSKLI